MAREATLFEEAGGSVVRGYVLIKQAGGNIPSSWLERASMSRTSRQKAVAHALETGGPADIAVIEDWDVAYRKECFYYGIRILLELERTGKTNL